MVELIGRYRWPILIAASALFIGVCAWFIISDAPGWPYLVRLYEDKRFLKQTLREWGILAPIFFILLQALQVVVSPIPGEASPENESFWLQSSPQAKQVTCAQGEDPAEGSCAAMVAAFVESLDTSN